MTSVISPYFVALNSTSGESPHTSMIVAPATAVVVVATLIVLGVVLAIILRRRRSGELQLKDNTNAIEFANPTYKGEVDMYRVFVYIHAYNLCIHILNHRWCKI